MVRGDTITLTDVVERIIINRLIPFTIKYFHHWWIIRLRLRFRFRFRLSCRIDSLIEFEIVQKKHKSCVVTPQPQWVRALASARERKAQMAGAARSNELYM